MKFRHLVAVTLIAGFAAGTQASASVVLYSQPYNGNTTEFYASQYDPLAFGAFAEVFDNFTLGSESQVTSLTWIGAFFNGTPLPITNFEVRFYNDFGGEPGALLNTYQFAGDANQTDNGNGTNTYSATLGIPFLANAGWTYWVSVVPTLDYPPQWGWAASDVGDFVSYQDFFGARTLIDPPHNFAFELQGTVVPEPAGFALAAIGIASLAALRFRQHRQSL